MSRDSDLAGLADANLAAHPGSRRLHGGYTSHILTGADLMPSPSFDLRQLALQTQASCPFCHDRIERATPRLPQTVHPEGRIEQGAAVLFPNLLAYAQYSSVSVYSPNLHFLPLEQMTQQLVCNNLSVQIEFGAAVERHDNLARWASINANHMLPSGSSLFHPHLSRPFEWKFTRGDLAKLLQRLEAKEAGRLPEAA